MKTADQKFKMPLQLVLVLALVDVLLPAFGRPQTSTTVEHQSSSLIRSVEGPDLFRAYCTSCHGLDARGAGPAAPALKAKVPDLGRQSCSCSRFARNANLGTRLSSG